MMAENTKAAEAAAKIAEANPYLVITGFRCPGRYSDPAVGGVEHTEFFLQLDKSTQKKVMAAKLDGDAAVLKALADSHTEIAGILKSDG
jgi:hypothetical protein